jgi:protein phosphatase
MAVSEAYTHLKDGLDKVSGGEVGVHEAKGDKALGGEVGVCEAKGDKALGGEVGVCGAKGDKALGGEVGVCEAKGDKEIAKLLVRALFSAHDAIKEKAKTDLNLMGMGTTLVEMVVKDGKAHICHIGDSRAYILREGIRQITRDHTVGDYLVEHNIMSREEVPPRKWHTLTQAVGLGSESLVPELNSADLEAGDYLLLCSDGLTDMLRDEEIEKVVRGCAGDVNMAVDALVEEANSKGGRDNISVILVEYG